MKKIFTLVALLSVAAFSHAQDFGKTLLSGSVSYSSNKTEISSGIEYKNSEFGVRPKVGFFVSPRVALGISAGYGSTFSPQSLNVISPVGYPTNVMVDYTTRTFNVGPFVRAYRPLGEKAAFFGQISAYYSHGKSEFESYSFTNSSATISKGGGADVAPGFVFFPSRTLGLEFTMGSIRYSKMKSQQEGSEDYSKSSNFGANFGLSSLSLGVSLYLGRTAAE